MLKADVLLAIGSFIGIAAKAVGLIDPETTWTRKSSLPNLLFYPITGLLPYFWLELWFSFTAVLASIGIWTGIYLYRAPKEERWHGFKRPLKEVMNDYGRRLRNFSM